jgi:hypothetical protein
MSRIKHVRITRTALNAAETNNLLLPGELYLITDEGKIAIGTSTNTYVEAMKTQPATDFTPRHLAMFGPDGDVCDSGVDVDDSSVSADAVWSAFKTKAYVDALVTTGSTSIHSPVGTLAQARALNDLTDKMLLNIEVLGLYRYDAEGTGTDDGNLIIKPTAMSGRLFKMTSILNNHESLDGLQGGTANDRYHLTNAEKQAATRNASSSQSGILTAADWANFNSKANGTHAHGVGDLTNFDDNVRHVIDDYTIECSF